MMPITATKTAPPIAPPMMAPTLVECREEDASGDPVFALDAEPEVPEDFGGAPDDVGELDGIEEVVVVVLPGGRYWM